jgi:hypothetical protein
MLRESAKGLNNERLKPRWENNKAKVEVKPTNPDVEDGKSTKYLKDDWDSSKDIPKSPIDNRPMERRLESKKLYGGSGELLKRMNPKLKQEPLGLPSKANELTAPKKSMSNTDTPPPKKESSAASWLKKNPGTIMGAAQLAGGLLSARKNAREEKSIQDIKSPAAAFSNEAQKIKSAADQTASAIMNGTNKSNADAMGNYMRVAKESGGSSAAAVLANSAKVTAGGADNYLKGMTAAAQIKMGAQEASSRMVTEGAKAESDTQVANRQFKEARLARKSENANAMIGAGAANVVGQSMNNNFNDRLTEVEKKYKGNVAGKYKNGGQIKRSTKLFAKYANR